MLDVKANIGLSVVAIEAGMQERVLLFFFKCVSSQHTFNGIFYRLTRHHALCQVLLLFSPADSSQKPYEVDTVIIAPILLSRKLRLREVQRLAKVLLASERWS